MAPGVGRPVACKKECYICGAWERGSTGMECENCLVFAFSFPIYFCLLVATVLFLAPLFSGVWGFSFSFSFFLCDFLEEL